MNTDKFIRLAYVGALAEANGQTADEAFAMLKARVTSEVKTARGRIDADIEMPKFVWESRNLGKWIVG